MKKMFLTICAGLAMLAIGSSVYGQDKNGKVNLSLDVASGFVWRGLHLNTSPVMQPSFTLAPGKLSIGAWASIPFTPDEYQEVDVFINFQFTPSLSLTLTDYFGYGYWGWSAPSYFNYKREETAHALDLQLGYNGDGGFKAMISTIIAGDDLKWEGSFVATSKNNYSTYIELGYGNTTSKGIDWEIFTGFVPMSSDFYNIKNGGVINLGVGLSKSFEITPTYSLPLSLKFIVNPSAETVFLTAGITLF